MLLGDRLTHLSEITQSVGSRACGRPDARLKDGCRSSLDFNEWIGTQSRRVGSFKIIFQPFWERGSVFLLLLVNLEYIRNTRSIQVQARQMQGMDTQRWNSTALLCLHGIYFYSPVLPGASSTSVPFQEVIKSSLNNEFI